MLERLRGAVVSRQVARGHRTPPLTVCQWPTLCGAVAGGTIDWKSMAPATESEIELEAIALAFGATVHALRLHVGISLNELARRAKVEPAYIHRLESRAAPRPHLPRLPRG